MGDQRRRGGRGRSGRGGRIPRRGEGGGTATIHDETFTSFPLDMPTPIRITSAVDEAAVEALLGRTLAQERRQAAGLQRLADSTGDSVIADLRVQVERHRDTLEQLARDLGARPAETNGGGHEGETGEIDRLLSEQRLVQVAWAALQRAAYASGDRRVDRVVKPVLREKCRHAEVLEAFALRQATAGLFRELED